jgi:hypothetical protein
MYYVLAFLVGVIVGGICLLVIVWEWQKTVQRKAAGSELRLKQANEVLATARAKENELALLIRPLFI